MLGQQLNNRVILQPSFTTALRPTLFCPPRVPLEQGYQLSLWLTWSPRLREAKELIRSKGEHMSKSLASEFWPPHFSLLGY